MCHALPRGLLGVQCWRPCSHERYLSTRHQRHRHRGRNDRVEQLEHGTATLTSFSPVFQAPLSASPPTHRRVMCPTWPMLIGCGLGLAIRCYGLFTASGLAQPVLATGQARRCDLFKDQRFRDPDRRHDHVHVRRHQFDPNFFADHPPNAIVTVTAPCRVVYIPFLDGPHACMVRADCLSLGFVVSSLGPQAR